MKCIHCAADTNYTDRHKNGGHCKECQHRFAFEPKADVKFAVADGGFASAVRQVSADNTLPFTGRQLYYGLNRQLYRKRPPPGSGWGALTILSTIGGIALAVGTGLIWPVVIAGVCAAGSGAQAYRVHKKPPPRTTLLSFDDFQRQYLERWQQVHGPIEKLLPDTRRDAEQRSNNTTLSPDITQFSFDRVVVTDTAETAQFLLAANFHFENNCAILSVDGFPAAVHGAVKEMLSRNPHLLVFALHDASESGYALAARLRETDWFPDQNIFVMDLGLRPRQAQALRLMTVREPGDAVPLAAGPLAAVPMASENLSSEEIAWLSGNRAELAALAPVRLLRSVFQGISRGAQAHADGTLLTSDTNGIWFYSAGADLTAADSFG